MIESALLLFLVIDPFGNLPFVLSILGDSPPSMFRRIVVREVLLAFLTLALFVLAGEQLLGYLSITQPAIAVAGGVILFLISLKMIFRSAAQIFDDNYRQEPFLVPIAVPSLAGPSAITTVMILQMHDRPGTGVLLLSLGIVMLVTTVVFLLGQRIAGFLGQRGLRALEKFMGLLLNLIAVNMTLVGVKEFFMNAQPSVST